MKNLMKLLALQFFVLLLSAGADADCNHLALQLQLGSYSFNSGTQQQLNLTVSKTGSAECSFFITASKGLAIKDYNRKLSKGTGSIAYQLYTSYPFNFILKDIPEAISSNDVLPGIFNKAGNASMTLTYWGVLGNAAYQPWGNYQDIVTIKLYQGTVNGNYQLVTSQSMTFSYNEPKAIDLSLVPSGASFDPTQTSMLLNFGTLFQGESRGFDVVMMYNAGYQLSVASTGAGKMLNTASSKLAGVPYTLSVNGVPADLSGGLSRPAIIASGGGVSPSTGAREPVSVTIGSTAQALAGTYGDVLFLVVTSTE